MHVNDNLIKLDGKSKFKLEIIRILTDKAYLFIRSEKLQTFTRQQFLPAVTLDNLALTAILNLYLSGLDCLTCRCKVNIRMSSVNKSWAHWETIVFTQ